MEREEMILALTRYELQYLLDNPDLLPSNAEFFARGGFSTYTDEQLQTSYDNNVWVGESK